MRVYVLATLSFCLPISLQADEPKNLLKPINQVESWRLEEHEGAKGTAEAMEDGIKFIVTEVDGTNWHLQVSQVDLNLVEGKQYTVKFKAMSPESRGYSLVAMIDQEDWHEIGLHEDLYASKQLREESFTFTATDVADKKNRIGFVLGDEKGTLIIKDMTLTEK